MEYAELLGREGLQVVNCFQISVVFSLQTLPFIFPSCTRDRVVLIIYLFSSF